MVSTFDLVIVPDGQASDEIAAQAVSMSSALGLNAVSVPFETTYFGENGQLETGEETLKADLVLILSDRTTLAQELGLPKLEVTLQDTGPIKTSLITVNSVGATSLPGISAIGACTTLGRTVSEKDVQSCIKRLNRLKSHGPLSVSPPKLRHPEKSRKADSTIPRKPSWIRKKKIESPTYFETRRLMRDHNLATVCEEAACPNIGECWSKRHATMMIMGDTCTRGCSFCNVATGRPDVLDVFEPGRVAQAVKKLELRHVVITSVDRDDLADGGADHIAQTIRAIRHQNPYTTIEVLTPDFLGKGDAAQQVFDAAPDVFNHNLETVPHLYPQVRPGARYYSSLRLLDDAKRADPQVFTKSGLMVGLGESFEDLRQVMDDLRAANVDFLTVGQYLQPTPKHHPIDRFVPPEEFEQIERMARSKGFLGVSATPLTRSSFHADEDFAALKKARQQALARGA